jgi:UDP-N-acetylglucosamine--N-acetylmuramyl-(pentapeptide) pyrophosphoryl-undecaprenol N-acetylglucosamine transferase
LAGGGTGGHVYPAISIADAIKGIVPEAAIMFAGTRDRMEWEKVPQAGYDIRPITVSGIQRRLTADNLKFPFKLAKGMYDSLRLVGDFDPDVAVGTGGYVSGPVLLAATLRARPLVLQEQNAYAGLTNKLLSRRAAQVHIAFEEARDYIPNAPCIFSGNPTRKALQTADRAEGRAHFDVPEEATLLLLTGGSLGSQALNDAMEAHYRDFLDEHEDAHILWQCGARYHDHLAGRVDDMGGRMHLMKFIDRMDLAYAATDLAFCRAGAITCSELMVTETPSILVPSPNVTEDHQTKNARSMEKGDAAVLLPEPELDERFADEVRELLADEDRRTQMARAAGRLARPDAARRIAHSVLSLAGWRGRAEADA